MTLNYIITETTDGRFIGTIINGENLFLGNSILLGEDVLFEIDNIKGSGSTQVIINSNYVIYLKKEVN